MITFLPLCSTLSMIERSGSRPPISCTTASISGSFRTVDKSVVNRPGGGTILRGRLSVRIDDPHQLHLPAGLAGNAVLVFEQEPCHARADRPEADNGNFCGRVCHRCVPNSCIGNSPNHFVPSGHITAGGKKASTRWGSTYPCEGGNCEICLDLAYLIATHLHLSSLCHSRIGSGVR